jgi:hypothetical protein
MATQHDAAMAYAARGWPVFPLKPKGKEPLTEHGLKDATTDAKVVDAWWRQFPAANIALRTGDAFDVLDLDGPEAVEVFRAWCADHGVDPADLRVAVSKTGKGWHYLFQPCGVGNRARLLGAPIDWRGTGGYIVAPPSVHPSGALYRWVVHSTAPLPPVPAPLREVLAPTVRVPLTPTLPRTVFDDSEHAAWFKAGYEAELDRVKQAQPGERNATLFSALCNVIELVNAGLAASAVDDLCEAGRIIGLSDAEVDQTALSAARKVGTTARELPPPRATAPARTRPVAPPAAAPAADLDLPPQAAALRPSDLIYQGFIGEAVRALDPWTEGDPVGVLATLLAGAGCAIGRGPHALVSTTHHPLLVWPLLLGRTSTGRKGTAHDVAESLIALADPVFASGNITGGLSSGEGLIHAVRDPVLETSNDPAKEPKLIDAGVQDKRCWVVETEFGGTMARAKREGSSLSAVLRQAWDGKTLATLTKSSVIATGAHIAISAHVSPREFLMRLRDSDLVGGTYNRFLPLLITRSKLLPEAPSPPRELMTRLGEQLRLRMQAAHRRGWIPRTPAAAEMWHDVYAELSVGEDDTDNDRLGQFIARSIPYTLRLSVLYALLDGEAAVDVRHIEAAAALVRYSIASVRVLLRSPEDDQVARLTAYLTEAGSEGASRTNVNDFFRGRLTAPELDDLLGRIPGLEVHRVVTGGRPAIRYVVGGTGQ